MLVGQGRRVGETVGDGALEALELGLVRGGEARGRGRRPEGGVVVVGRGGGG